MIELEKDATKKVIYDFSKCMYDISIATQDGLINAFPELSAYEEFLNAKDDNEIKVSLLLADFGSPFIKVKDTKQKVSAIFACLDIDVEKEKTFYNSIVGYTNDSIAGMCGVFLQMQNNHDFTYWWNTNLLYYSLMIEMGKPRGKDEDVTKYVDRKLKIQKQAEPIKASLLDIEAVIFSDSKMKQQLAKLKLKMTRTYPEMYAQDNQTE